MPAAVSEDLKVVSRDFAVVLYPLEDEKHERVFRYIINHERLYSPVWITHDKDIDEDGNPKKSHVHMLCRMPTRTSLSGFLKSLSNYISFAEPVHNLYSYLLYMVHDTLEADADGKHSYPIDCLHGDSKLISKVFGQNPYFVQLGEFAERCREGANISDIIIDTVAINDKSQRDIAYETFTKFSHVICCMSNQEKNDIKERNRRNADAIEGRNYFDTQFEEYPQIKVLDEV